jgi:hypothetical protein
VHAEHFIMKQPKSRYFILAPFTVLEALSLGTNRSTGRTTILPNTSEKTNAGIKIIHTYDVAYVFGTFRSFTTNAIKPSSPIGPGFTSFPI